MTDDTREGRTEQLWECPECGEFFHDSEQVGGLGEPAWDMPAECGPCGGIEMTLVGPMTTEEYRRRKKLVLRAEPSGDVGEEYAKVIARWAYERGLSAEDAATLMDQLARLHRTHEPVWDDYKDISEAIGLVRGELGNEWRADAAEAQLRNILARLRRTPETEALIKRLGVLADLWEGRCAEDYGTPAGCVNEVGDVLDACVADLRRALESHKATHRNALATQVTDD